MNKSTGNFIRDRWTLTFKGGPMAGKTIKYHCCPEGRFGKRSKDTGEQFFYVATEVNEERGTALMVLG